MLFLYCEKASDCECAYILDENGIQLTNTCFPDDILSKLRVSKLFTPGKKGSDHSLKTYFYRSSLTRQPYMSLPYISNATGTVCLTMVMPFENSGFNFYFCVDFPASE